MPPKSASQGWVVWPSLATRDAFAVLAGSQYFAKCKKSQRPNESRSINNPLQNSYLKLQREIY